MSIEQRKVVDFVGLDKIDGHAILTISDHLPWLPDDGHLAILQDKINDYLTFIEAGEIYDVFPQAYGRPIEIQVVCKYPPVDDAVRFLEFAREKVRDAGFLFSYHVFEVADDDEG